MSAAGRSRVVVTGLGAVSPIGVGVPAYTAAARAGRPGCRRLPFRHDGMRSTVGALCEGFDAAAVVGSADARRLPRLVSMALAAAVEAMGQAGLVLSREMDPDDPGNAARGVGVVLGTGAGGIDFTLDQAEAFHHGRGVSLWTITNATHGNLAGELSIRLGCRGPSLCVSTGCASSSDAIGLALLHLRHTQPGSPDAFVVVGADAHVRPETLMGMELLKVITTTDYGAPGRDASRASRPFDATRDGFVLGEGAWALVLEREGAALARGAQPLAEALGAAATCDAYHRVRPDPSMTECVRAIRLALEDASLAPEWVDVVHYHGTSTRVNDAAETSAVKRVFGGHARRLRGSSIKSMIGHPQGACGAAAAVATIGALTSQDGHVEGPFIPPTINYEHADPECDLDVTPNERRLTDARTALINCLAFGAKNTALVIRVRR